MSTKLANAASPGYLCAEVPVIGIRELREWAPRGDLEQSPLALRTEIQCLHDRYRALDRSEAEISDLVWLKLSLIGWRQRWLSSGLTAVEEQSPVPANDWLEWFDTLGVWLPDEARQRLGSGLGNDDLFARLVAGQGQRVPGFEGYFRAAGPDRSLPIRPNEGSKWPFARWSQDSRFSEYAMDEAGVAYRGLRFCPGDVLVTNVNREGNGLYTCLSEPANYGSHSGFFALLSGPDGSHYPAVMETYERGVRAVPLSLFLHPQFSSYVELYRHRDVGPQHWPRINQAAQEMMERVRGYNFDTEDRNPHYVACTVVGAVMLEAAGIEAPRARSRVADTGIQRNLGALGYSAFTYFAPVDYARDPTLGLIGWVDNGDYVKMVCREWVDRYIRQLFSDGRIRPNRMPIEYRINHWGIGQIQRRSAIGRLIGWWEGFDADTLPLGPRKLMALIQVAEGQLRRATQAVYRDLEACVINADPRHLEKLGQSPEVRACLARHVRLPWLQ